MRPVISSALLLELIAAAGGPVEICGLLRGRGGEITHADRAANVAGDPARAFEIDPAALIAAHRGARLPAAPQVLGCFHSHPGGQPEPSAVDAASAAPDGQLWLILTRNAARFWRAVAAGQRHGRFDPVAFDITGPHVEKGLRGVQVRAERLRPWEPAS